MRIGWIPVDARGPAMLTYFPQPYEGESVYSMAARYGNHLGAASWMVSKTLFGREHRIQNYHSPRHLAQLATRLPAGFGLTVDKLITDHTAFGYYKAIHLPEHAAKLRDQMLAKTRRGNLLARKGPHWMPPETFFRFCSVCFAEMVDAHGEAFWRIDHQLPGVLVCPDHACDLQESTARISVNQFIPADRRSCPAEAPSSLAILGEAPRADLLELARWVTRLRVDGGYPAGEDPRNRDDIIASLTSLGFGNSGGVHHAKLSAAIIERFGYLAPVWPDLFSRVSQGKPNLNKYRSGYVHPVIDPILHFFIRKLIGANLTKKAANPFGQGPWPCLNRFSDHFQQLTVTDMMTWRSKGRACGRFTCRCGFSYKRSVMGDGRLLEPRVVDFGHLMGPFLAECQERGLTLEQASIISRCDVRKLSRLAAQAGVSWTSRVSRVAQGTHTTRTELTGPRKVRRDEVTQGSATSMRQATKREVEREKIMRALGIGPDLRWADRVALPASATPKGAGDPT